MPRFGIWRPRCLCDDGEGSFSHLDGCKHPWSNRPRPSRLRPSTTRIESSEACANAEVPQALSHDEQTLHCACRLSHGKPSSRKRWGFQVQRERVAQLSCAILTDLTCASGARRTPFPILRHAHHGRTPHTHPPTRGAKATTRFFGRARRQQTCHVLPPLLGA